jgi:hypothetical protein
MNRTIPFVAVAAAVAFSACAGNPARMYSAPAPANALACALRTTAGLGYTPIAGGVNDGYIRLARKSDSNLGGAVAAAMIPGRRNPAAFDHITVTGAGETLRISAVGVDSKEKPTNPSSESDGHVQAIIAGCGTPATHSVNQ